jgi:MFS superfamily sulfate permease-like transporter
MAFAISSGLSPQAGIYCAIITGFLISALGGSRFQIGGPTGAFVVVVSGIVTRYGVDGLFTCTLMAGRVARDWRHRAYRDQHSRRRQDTGFRHGARAHSAERAAVWGIACGLHPASGALGNPVRCRLEHGRLAGDRGHSQAVVTDMLVWLATFALTVLADLTVAVEVGMVLAALLFIRRVAQTTTVSRVTREYIEAGRAHILQDKVIPDYVAIFRIHGPFLFGATDKLRDIGEGADILPPVVILRLRNTTALDATGLSAIEDLAEELRAKGRTLVICGAPSQPAALMRKAEFHRHVGDANICRSVADALARAAVIVNASEAEARVV